MKLTILGSGAATPTLKRGVTAQYLNFNERRILIDCGEGTQLQVRRYGVKFQRIQYIFISHLHGDHYLGLVGLLSSMNLLGRVNAMHIFAAPELELILKQQFELTYVKLNFELIFHHLTAKTTTLVLEDKVMTVKAIPLKHRISCYGFLFEEKIKERGVDPEAIKEFDLTIPEILALKAGKDVMRGEITMPNEDATFDPPKPKSYAFCTDTKYLTRLVDEIQGVDYLYHEATFLEKEKDRAKATFHTTALQAATLAKAAQVGHLLLGHFSARYRNTDELLSEAQSVFPNTTCVYDGQEFYLAKNN
ncbi:ribonuclease Z [Putridiphycobacter roseus]|uniref:Ribonuclease Z n=1 Tax=Putridiphycobacter roseus TaxID=2219161 RepID=A0A2W1N1U2_9FLAO|nr:ribonuclease Z [Putridiphycobacter roseus]